MSHISDIKDVKLTSLEAIIQACAAKGWSFRENQKTYAWYKKWVGDSPLPRAIFETEEEFQRVNALPLQEQRKIATRLLGQCEHAIHVPGARYEIGLVRRGDHWVPLFDWWRSGGLEHLHTRPGMDGFLQEYALAKALIDAKAQGYTHPITERLPNGAVLLRIPTRQRSIQ